MFGLSGLRLGIYAFVALAFLASLAYGKWQHHRAESAIARADSVEAQLDTATDANASLVTTVQAQDKALKQWAALGISPADAAAAIASAKTAQDSANEAWGRLAALKDKDRALPDCIALLKTSLSRRCPAVADGLLKLSRGHENGSGRDPGAGSETAPRRIDEGLRASLPVRGQRPDR
jgi:hypothetical protein